MGMKDIKVTATLKVIVTGEFYDFEASEETLRSCVEQDLEEVGFDVDVELLKEQGEKEQCLKTKCTICPHCDNCDVDENGKIKESTDIVRCKDCKNWIAGYITDKDEFIPPKCGKYRQMVGHSSDDFCSLAERRETDD